MRVNVVSLLIEVLIKLFVFVPKECFCLHVKQDGDSRECPNGVNNSTEPRSAISSENRLQDPADGSECDEMSESYTCFR